MIAHFFFMYNFLVAHYISIDSSFTEECTGLIAMTRIIEMRDFLSQIRLDDDVVFGISFASSFIWHDGLYHCILQYVCCRLIFIDRPRHDIVIVMELAVFYSLVSLKIIFGTS